MATSEAADSPRNEYFPNDPPMRKPAMSFLYRLECDIADEELDVGAPNGTDWIRSVANIRSGTLRGP